MSFSSTSQPAMAPPSSTLTMMLDQYSHPYSSSSHPSHPLFMATTVPSPAGPGLDSSAPNWLSSSSSSLDGEEGSSPFDLLQGATTPTPTAAAYTSVTSTATPATASTSTGPPPVFLHTPFDDTFLSTTSDLITPMTTFEVFGTTNSNSVWMQQQADDDPAAAAVGAASSSSLPNSFTTSFHSPRFNLYDNHVEYKIEINLDGLDLHSEDIEVSIVEEPEQNTEDEIEDGNDSPQRLHNVLHVRAEKKNTKTTPTQDDLGVAAGDDDDLLDLNSDHHATTTTNQNNHSKATDTIQKTSSSSWPPPLVLAWSSPYWPSSSLSTRSTSTNAANVEIGADASNPTEAGSYFEYRMVLANDVDITKFTAKIDHNQQHLLGKHNKGEDRHGDEGGVLTITAPKMTTSTSHHHK